MVLMVQLCMGHFLQNASTGASVGLPSPPVLRLLLPPLPLPLLLLLPPPLLLPLSTQLLPSPLLPSLPDDVVSGDVGGESSSGEVGGAGVFTMTSHGWGGT